MIEYISAISHKIVKSSRPKVFCEKGVKKVKKDSGTGVFL